MATQVIHGLLATVVPKSGQPYTGYPIRLYLTAESLDLEREEVQSTVHPGIRKVMVKIDLCGGLGINVKGGSEHNLPVLISRIIAGEGADKTGQLHVGDAITMVNNIGIENCSHDDAVDALRTGGDEVVLTVEHFPVASQYLYHAESQPPEKQKTEFQRCWVSYQSLPLLYAHVTKLANHSDSLSGFEMIAVDGASSGEIQFDSGQEMLDVWNSLCGAIDAVNQQQIQKTNKTMLPSEQIYGAWWVFEKQRATQYCLSWKKLFMALKGSDVYIFDKPPIASRDWLRYNRICRIYESMFRILKESECVDARQWCYVMEGHLGETGYYSVERRDELISIEQCWWLANFKAVHNLRYKTFGCIWCGQCSGLTLDIDTGFALYDNQAKCYVWAYKFSQLKGSSDDGKSRLKLLFQTGSNKMIETREVECSTLKSLLYTMHAFLSAKLASVDPKYLTNV